MNESVNTLVNQLIDAGTMANTAGGFLGRGVKLKGGKSSFDPFEWKPVDSTGNDLRQNIFPLPVREPSGVLFQLLGMLIEYSEKISGATDIMSGISPGQNTPAETSRNTVEQGMMLFSGIYTRMHRAFTAELRKLHRLNQLFIEDSPRFYELSTGADALLAKGDYTNNSFRIAPSVGAESVSQSQRREKALMVYQLAGGAPGFDRYKVTVNLLEAHDVDDIDGIFPDPAGPKAIAPPVNPKIELEKEKLAQNKQEHQDNMALAIAGLKNELQLTEAKIAELHAKASKELSEAQGVETGHQIALMEMQLAEQKHKRDGILSSLGVLNKFAETKLKHNAQLQGAKPTGEIDNGNNDAG
jgi:chaperonin GroES